jgi:hypothetical protein
MNYITQQLITAISDADVATYAGKSSGDWTTNHVFLTYDLGQFCYSINIGNLPLVVVNETNADYEKTATSTGSEGGMVDVYHTVRIMTNSFYNMRENNYRFLNGMKALILSKLPFAYELVGIETSPIQTAPICTYLDFEVHAERTYNNTFCEDN